MTTRYAVAVYAKPQTADEKQLNFDAVTLLNMLGGMSYEDAKAQAAKDIKEMANAETGS